MYYLIRAIAGHHQAPHQPHTRIVVFYQGYILFRVQEFVEIVKTLLKSIRVK